MKADIAVLADAANVSREGKLNITGIFRNIYGPQLPILWPVMVLALQLEFDADEKGKPHSIAIELIAPNGQVLQKLPEMNAEIPSDAPGEHPTFPVTLNLVNVGLPFYGIYRFALTFNGEHAQDITFEVGQPPAQ